jgi:hypothetical protein
MGIRSFPEVKRPGRGVNHPPHLAPRERKSTAVLLLPHCAFMADCRVNWIFTFTLFSFLPAYQSSTYSDKYQESHRYGIFSWWWAHNCTKYEEKSNKYIKKICATIWFHLQKTVLSLLHQVLIPEALKVVFIINNIFAMYFVISDGSFHRNLNTLSCNLSENASSNIGSSDP